MPPRRRALAGAAGALLAAAVVAAAPAPAEGQENDEAVTPPTPIVIAHRGASGYLPEHTLPAYALAHGMGADYIEPDLVLTRDRRLICLHDIYLQATTNVEQVFPDRVRDDGRWYAADFTLDEIRQLQAEERLDDRFPRGGSRFAVPAFTEMIELVQGLNARTGRNAGIYPELKAPAWHREQGLDPEEALLEVLGRYGYLEDGAPVYVQSFEEESLMTPAGTRLQDAPGVPDGRGRALPAVPERRGHRERRRVRDRHRPREDDAGAAAGTAPLGAGRGAGGPSLHLPRRPGARTATKATRRSFERYLFDLGVDGVFTDYPDRARAVLDR